MLEHTNSTMTLDRISATMTYMMWSVILTWVGSLAKDMWFQGYFCIQKQAQVFI
jgi:hypothetical protein